jgi:hypothetical protein
MMNRVLKNLSWEAKRWISEWNQTSIDRRRLKYPAIEQYLRISGEHPVMFIAFIWSLANFLSVGIGWVIPTYFGSIFQTKWETAELLSYFGTLWTLQGTIAALVYPIVIAFVAVLLQRRATAKLSLRIYSLDAAVIPAGASAFALLTWMGIEYISLPYVPESCLIGAMIGNSVWFVLNLLLTGWFLCRTVRFLNDEERIQVFTRFAVQVAFPREVKTHLLGLIFSNSQINRLIPGKDYSNEDTGPKVWLYPISEGAPCITIRCHTERAVTDVRLRLLAWGVSLWLRRQDKIAPRPVGVRTNVPLLVIPIIPGGSVEGEVALCRVRDAIPPGPVASFFIRHSVVFGPPPRPDSSFSTTEILEELAVETLTLAEQRRFEAARETLSAMADLHVALIRSGAFINDNGEHDNTAKLQEPYGLGSRKLHESWLGVYRQVAEKAVRDLTTDTTLFRRMCYLVYRMINRLRGQDLEILIYVLHLSTHLMYRLGIWWAEKVEERGFGAHDALHGVELPLPLGGTYDRALQTFIEGWEGLELREADEPYSPNGAWAKHSRSARFAAAQAEGVVRMLLGAVARGDKAAALWIADSFLKWWDKQRHNFPRYSGYRRWNPLLTFACVRGEWSDVRKLLDAIPEGPQEVVFAGEVVAGMLHSYWTDLRLLAILILLDWTPADAPENAFTIELAVALMEGFNIKHGEVDVKPLKNPNDVLFRLARIQLADHEYEQMLNKVIDNAHDLRKPDMVAGRIYSSSGSHDFESLCLAQGQMLVAIAAGPVEQPRAFAAAMRNWDNDLQRLQTCKRLFEKLGKCIAPEAFTNRSVLTANLRRALQLPENIEEALAWIATAFKDLANLAVEIHDERLTAAEVSQARLDEIGRAVSDYVLSTDNNKFPFSLVSQRKQVPDAGKPRALSFSGVRKQPFTDPPLENEDPAWLNNYVVDSIAAGLVEGYINSTNPEPLRLDSKEIFFNDLSKKAEFLRKKRLTPLLLVPVHAPELINPWEYQRGEEGQPANISVRLPTDSDAAGLIGHFNDVPAYETQIREHCYIVAKEHFDVVVYSIWPSGACISVSATPEANHQILLRLEWRFGTELSPFKYR